jgi:hypothetical protein
VLAMGAKQFLGPRMQVRIEAVADLRYKPNTCKHGTTFKASRLRNSQTKP